MPWLIPLILLTLSCASGPSAPLESAAPAAAQPVATALVATTQVASTAPALIPPPATATPTLVPTPAPTPTPINLPVPQGTADAPEDAGDQRTIAGLRARPYESGPLEIVRTLATTPTYTSYFITYPSDGLRVTGYLNVPRGDGPFPVLLVNHGYVNPMGYVAVASNYTKREGDFLATRGYLTAGSDYRGHGNSPGTAVGAHLETAYAIDTLNLLAALKAFPQADTARVGVWGHSNGGSISERIMVVSKDVDATVIWAGVSSDAVDAWLYLRDWIRRPEREVRERYGHPDEQPDLFRRMSARYYLAEIAGPVQIHHGTADASVPYAHAVSLDRALTAAGKPHQLLTYPGAPHNWFGATWDTAMGRTVAYFDANVRG